jgi:ATP-dependent helicase/nuclease subunit B
VREPPTTRPRLYTIPPSAPFLSTLARAVLAGDLPAACGTKPDPLDLPRAVIYLPTRRAVRALRDAFLDAAGGAAVLLPSIRALGDPDEDEAIIFGGEGDTEEGFARAGGARAIDPLERRLALMRLVLAWSKRLHESGEASPGQPVPPIATPAQASYLAADLGILMDFIESEEVDLSALEDLAPEDYAEHWAKTVDFLRIVTEHWPAHLSEQGLVSPTARRNALMDFEAGRLRAYPPTGPVIAAGSTGTVPATARLLKVIASLPNGAVVLPGLDFSLDAESWASLPEHPEHPQAGMAKLLTELGASREDVSYVPGSAPDERQQARLDFASEVLRPAGETDRWQTYLESDGARAQLAGGLAGLQAIETPTAHDEAEAIALVLRETVETPGKTAALITPDRTLARRVAARLKAYDLVIDDSAGVPVARTLPGGFLDLIAAVSADFAPPELMALLKHPLALLGREPATIREAARILERIAFRDVYVGQGLAGAAEAVKAAPDKESRRRNAVGIEDQRIALKLIDDLRGAFAPLSALFADAALHTAAEFAGAHVAAAEALASDSAGSSSHLWQGTAGEAMSVLLAELIAQGGKVQLAPADYAPFYRSLLAGRVARPRRPAHPRLFIWGPLEARLQQPDVVILGSLNEGVWPRPQEASPWLSRPMAAKLGLPPPERRIGLSAHDFAQALGAPTVYLSRAVKADGVPTVPSRWLQRLNAIIEAAELKERIVSAQPWASWARERDAAPAFAPVDPPRPCPPVEARPRRLSVTRIEHLLANPYAIFARYILGLEAMKPLGELPDNAMRGQIVHHALHQFALNHPKHLPADIAAELIASADDLLSALGGSPRVEAFWRPGFARFAKWFAETEPTRRSGIERVMTEVDGALDLEVERGFRLTARADRIDLREDGGVVIYDYKTGRVPTVSQVDKLYAPQLPLEAAIVAGGGFVTVGAREVRGLQYVRASGRGEGGEEQPAAKAAPSALADKALADLTGLIEHFDRQDTPYEAQRRPSTAFARIYDYDDYAHLARLAEWETLGLEEEIW